MTNRKIGVAERNSQEEGLVIRAWPLKKSNELIFRRKTVHAHSFKKLKMTTQKSKAKQSSESRRN